MTLLNSSACLLQVTQLWLGGVNEDKDKLMKPDFACNTWYHIYDGLFSYSPQPNRPWLLMAYMCKECVWLKLQL